MVEGVRQCLAGVVEQVGNITEQVSEKIARTGLGTNIEHDLICRHGKAEEVKINRPKHQMENVACCISRWAGHGGGYIRQHAGSATCSGKDSGKQSVRNRLSVLNTEAGQLQRSAKGAGYIIKGTGPANRDRDPARWWCCCGMRRQGGEAHNKSQYG